MLKYFYFFAPNAHCAFVVVVIIIIILIHLGHQAIANYGPTHTSVRNSTGIAIEITK